MQKEKYKVFVSSLFREGDYYISFHVRLNSSGKMIGIGWFWRKEYKSRMRDKLLNMYLHNHKNEMVGDIRS